MERKAGMGEVDMGEVNAFIAASTRGTRFAAAQDRRRAALKARADALVARVSALPPLTPADDAAAAEAVAALEARRDTARGYVHVDMDAFYCAVEAMDDPRLRQQQPFAVGSLDMLQTSSYAARRFGVRAGLPGFLAVQLCPQLEIVPPRLARYREVSARIHTLFRAADPRFRPTCLDEACLAVPAGRTPETFARELADAVSREFEGALTCSVGVAHSPQLAKMCAQVHKPAGLFALPPTREAALGFLAQSPCARTPGIGHVNAALLAAIGVTRCGQLLLAAPVVLQLFPRRTAIRLLACALGLLDATDNEDATTDNEPSSPPSAKKKSISRERTIRDFYDNGEMLALLDDLCKAAAAELGPLHVSSAREVVLKLRDIDFDWHEFPAETAVHDENELIASMHALWEGALVEIGGIGHIRTIGVRLSSFK